MNLFLAAVYTNQYNDLTGAGRWEKLNDVERAIVSSVPNNLESYHYVCSQKFVDAMRVNGAKVFLDSGAFSAKSLGVDINIDEYCNYIKRNEDILRVEDGIIMASVLDGIGDDLQTWRNQMYMESKGVRPLPCFHFGEDDRYLDFYANNYEYITLGGMAHSQSVVMEWLDRIWNTHLIDGSGRAKVKVHAFGVTSVNLMERYPWHSVDSSSWIQAAAFGSIYTADFGPITVSDKSPRIKDEGQHFNTISEIEREQLTKMIESRGFTYERLSTVYESRAAYNMGAYVEVGNRINENIVKRNHKFDCQRKQTLF